LKGKKSKERNGKIREERKKSEGIKEERSIYFVLFLTSFQFVA